MKKLKPKLLLIALVFLLFHQVSGQSIKRQTIGCLGIKEHNQKGVISQTVGQPFATNSFSDSKIGVFQGYQQPISYYRVTNENPEPEFKQLDVYPNPATDQFTINCSEISGSLVLNIVDISGRVLEKMSLTEEKIVSINASTWGAGIYIIRLINTETKESYSNKVVITK